MWCEGRIFLQNGVEPSVPCFLELDPGGDFVGGLESRRQPGFQRPFVEE